MAGFLSPLNDFSQVDILQKLSYVTPGSIYNFLDEGSRELLLWLSNDCGYGMGLGIVGISLGIKVIFGPVMIATQLNAVKMKLIEPEMKNF